ncbi:hypothetical protein CDQ92_06700 [Sphingopyxis bauzanensis]|uniref:Uncharacterized protein n=1 Tax=Sphingopyxis bauzanensis TaxID=651663 RepID=A0A246JUS6_9SPHN|nr:hypothetical protein CDQ92_06700 [Sphingopyxis bauzanensis]
MAAALSKLCACVQVELEDRRPPNDIKGDAGVFFAGNLPFVRLDGKTTGLAARKTLVLGARTRPSSAE